MKVETQRLGPDGKPMVDESGNKIMDSEGIWFKNQDEFVISVAPSFKMSDNWTYGSILNFRSQFVNGYKSRGTGKRSTSRAKFMTPGYLDISLGITYKSPKAKFPIVVNISPIALNATFAENELHPTAKRTDSTMVSRTPRRPPNTRAVRRSRSVSTARSARRDSCATARRSTPSTAGSPISARRTRSATIPNTGLHMTTG